ncbi:TetR family transcriptional regulator [Streptantibioticus silvisoli]|jgi:AcrR family transcriptional regulator|uniref:TetR family transcriptional regulator n=1 Tax=Streptantibioticus silvisoli TaxID=2705255 RepID=A0ABT6W2F9_9ACTN|nr:TetR family transcriptional regulator [Streptantibioticus silvisoli]MDI5964931.1 TetR family transcriptional regulator [Streptantibioticus silvisoli]
MARDSGQTKARLLEAATAELAEHGIAGARVDRIAKAASVNKQLIYAYFGNKDELFDTVFSSYVGHVMDDVDFDATDLPAYAGRLFDRFEDDPAALRLSTWYRLERPQGMNLEAVVTLNEVRLDRLRQAQRAGLLTTHFDPVQLLTLIQAVATSWATTNPEFSATTSTSRAYRRRTVIAAVERLLADGPGQT